MWWDKSQVEDDWTREKERDIQRDRERMKERET